MLEICGFMIIVTIMLPFSMNGESIQEATELFDRNPDAGILKFCAIIKVFTASLYRKYNKIAIMKYHLIISIKSVENQRIFCKINMYSA